jgi:hypothetical protein
METHKHECLNCGTTLISAYCHDCGQKADTHRVSLSHLVKHDLVHGVWHVDRGLLYTVRESFLRPGYMAMNYIRGKRIKYYNVFYLILIVIGINLLVAHFLKQHYNISSETTTGVVLHEDQVDVSYYVWRYFKLLLLLVIPFFAVSGSISFRKLKLNFAEHTIIAAHILLGGAMWYFFVIAGMYTSIDIDSYIFNLFVWGFVVMAWLHPVRVYYQATRNEYTPGAFAWRMLLWYCCNAILLGALVWAVLITISSITGKGTIKFG